MLQRQFLQRNSMRKLALSGRHLREKRDDDAQRGAQKVMMQSSTSITKGKRCFCGLLRGGHRLQFTHVNSGQWKATWRK